MVIKNPIVLSNIHNTIVELYRANKSVNNIYQILKDSYITIGKRRIICILKDKDVVLRTQTETSTRYEVNSKFFLLLIQKKRPTG